MEHGESGYIPGPKDLSDKDFVRTYPKSGFGWITGTEADKEIWERHARLEKENPEIYKTYLMNDPEPQAEEDEPENEAEKQARKMFSHSEDMSDKEFVKTYPKNGFGWVTGTKADNIIWDRHIKLQKENPEIYKTYLMDEPEPQTEEDETENEAAMQARKLFAHSENMSDEEFVRTYRRDGLGWDTGTKADNIIWERHARLAKEKPELYKK